MNDFIRRSVKKLLCAALIVCLLTVGCVIYYDGKMKPAVKIMAVSQMQDIATEIIHTSVTNILPDYGNMVTVSAAKDGSVRSVQVDTQTVNLLKSAVALDVLNKLKEIEQQSLISLPVGTLLGLEVLSALGPKLDVRILPVTSVFCDLYSTFDDVGINQTRHRMILTVTVTATLVLPTETTDVTYSVDTVCAETVILGDVPYFYNQ